MYGFNRLIHFTTLQNLKTIQLQNALLTRLEKQQLKVVYTGVANTTSASDDATAIIGEYPGIYFTALNKYDNGNVLDAYDYAEDVVYLVFSTSLLLRNDWHLNVNDQNGYINHLTYCRDTIEDYPHDASRWFTDVTGLKFIGNELIFHNKVSTQCLLAIWVQSKAVAEKVNSMLNINVPVQVMKTVPRLSPQLIPQFEPSPQTQKLKLCYGINTNSVDKYLNNPSKFLKRALLDNCGLKLDEKKFESMTNDQLNVEIYKAFAEAPDAIRLPPKFERLSIL